MKTNLKTVLSLLSLIFFFVIAVNSQSIKQTTTQSDNEKIYKLSEVDQKPEIINRPSPSPGENCTQNKGLTRVHAIFHKTGKITSAKVKQTSGCFGFDENALKAAREIKFKPAKKGSQPVSVGIVIEFNFSKF